MKKKLSFMLSFTLIICMLTASNAFAANTETVPEKLVSARVSSYTAQIKDTVLITENSFSNDTYQTTITGIQLLSTKL